jgi:hypothetical protein
LMNLGCCPVCKEVLSDKDIGDNEFRETITRHIAYRCMKMRHDFRVLGHKDNRLGPLYFI